MDVELRPGKPPVVRAETGGDAGSVASLKYERPANGAQQAQIRGGRGQFWQDHFTKTSSTAANTGDPTLL